MMREVRKRTDPWWIGALRLLDCFRGRSILDEGMQHVTMARSVN
jgi:hypothetical protein